MHGEEAENRGVESQPWQVGRNAKFSRNAETEPQPWQAHPLECRRGTEVSRVMAPWRVQRTQGRHVSAPVLDRRLSKDWEMASKVEQLAKPDVAGPVS